MRESSGCPAREVAAAKCDCCQGSSAGCLCLTRRLLWCSALVCCAALQMSVWPLLCSVPNKSKKKFFLDNFIILKTSSFSPFWWWNPTNCTKINYLSWNWCKPVSHNQNNLKQRFLHFKRWMKFFILCLSAVNITLKFQFYKSYTGLLPKMFWMTVVRSEACVILLPS